MNILFKFLKRLGQLILAVIIVFAAYGGYFYRDQQVEVSAGVQFMQTEASSIAYRAAGTDFEDKTPVVMIHAMFYHMGMWDQWANELSKNRAIYRFDVAGHGLSSVDKDDDYSLEATIVTLEQFLDHHGLEKVVLVGASMGGATAFNFAAHNPQRVEKMVLVNSGGLEGFDEEGSLSAPGWIYWILRYLPDSTLTSFVDWTAAENDTGDVFRAEFISMFRNTGVREGILGRMQDFKSTETRTVLPMIKPPTLIMWGAKNPQLPVEQASEFKELIEAGGADITLHIYEEAGHILPAEGFPQAVRDLINFLDEDAQ